MDDNGNGPLADRVADTITSMTGQVWDQAARMRLAVWLEDARHREDALRWLATPRETESMPAFELRMPMQSALAGKATSSMGGFIEKPDKWWRWRR